MSTQRNTSQEEPFAVLTPSGEIYARCWTLEEADSVANALEEQAGAEIGSMYLVVSTRDTNLERYTDAKMGARIAREKSPGPHTRGPWYVSTKLPLKTDADTPHEFYVYSEHGNIANVPRHLPGWYDVLKADANARLIAKSPSMDRTIRDFVEVSRSIAANWENGDLAERVNSLQRLAGEAESLLAA